MGDKDDDKDEIPIKCNDATLNNTACLNDDEADIVFQFKIIISIFCRCKYYHIFNPLILKVSKSIICYHYDAFMFMYYQFFHTALSFDPFIEPDETWKGYVKIRRFPVEALDPANDLNLKVIRDGILTGSPFVLPDEKKNSKS